MNRKTIVISALLALGIVSQAMAQNHIYITGSTAFRSKLFNAIIALPGWNPAITAPVAAFGGSHANGDNAQYMLFHGTYSNVDTYVSCYWSGSEAGIASVAAPGANPIYFLLDTASGISSGQPGSGQTNTVAIAPDICMADSSQTVSLTPTPKLVGQGTLGGTSDPGRVGVVTFTWAKNVNSNPSNFWSRITNITDAQARKLLAGPVKAALLTGNSNDVNYVYGVGRNSYSGTHVDCMLSTKVGLSFPPQQFSIGGFPHSSAAFVAGDPSALDFTSLVNNGYDGGGDVAKALSIDGSCQQSDINFGGTGWMTIGYLGMDDANNVGGTGNGPNYYLTLDGVAESDGAVEQGQYNYWNYEHMYGRTTISGYQALFGGALVTSIQGQLGGSVLTAHSGGIALGYMQATKSSDQADPAHK